jgi:hypothetical protein
MVRTGFGTDSIDAKELEELVKPYLLDRLLTTLELTKEQTLTFLTDLEQTHRWLLAIPEPTKGEQDHRAEWSVEWMRDGEYGGMTGRDIKKGYMQELSLTLALKTVLMRYRGESVIR